jgi:hypothetical protein
MSSFLTLNQMTYLIPIAWYRGDIFDCMCILNAKLFSVVRLVEVCKRCICSSNKPRKITNV